MIRPSPAYNTFDMLRDETIILLAHYGTPSINNQRIIDTAQDEALSQGMGYSAPPHAGTYSAC
jgi:hypothetical protein